MIQPSALQRMPTGIRGLDEALGGGLPRGRATLVVGGPGAGKTIFAVQALAEGSRRGEAGLLVTFEESAREIVTNVADLEWSGALRNQKRVGILDGSEVRTAFRNGSFDLSGLLAAAAHRSRRAKVQRIVFDGLDVLLDMIDDPAAMRREACRLSEWLSERALTAIITVREESHCDALPARYAFLPFLEDCVIVLQHRVLDRTAARSLRIMKCRGVAHSSNELPMVISRSGIEVHAPNAAELNHRVFADRVSTGVARLDTMLEGGYLRGTCTLISGAPGTSKTSLAGAFAEAACGRGERTLFVSFDEAAEAIVRNLTSVNIRLGRFIRSGLLRMHSVRAHGLAAEGHICRLTALLDEQRTSCLVIDPVSALVHVSASQFASESVQGLIDLAKRRGITIVLTSLLEGTDASDEGTAIGISTIADTWMQLSYVQNAGERNRALTIIKSRGTGHSNQVRELVLRHTGLSLVDVYTAGGAVLMGTLRWEKEQEERAKRKHHTRLEADRRAEIGATIAKAESEIARLRADVERRRAELRREEESSRDDAAAQAAQAGALRTLRRADATAARRPSAGRPRPRSR